MEKNIFKKIKENQIKSAAQGLSVVLLVIVTVLVFLTSVGRPLLNVLYIIVLIIIGLINLPALAVTWWIYLAAAVIGTAVINLLSMALSGVLAAAQQDLLVSAFGYTSDENDGGAVPVSCVKPFDPKEKALNELELKYNTNSITEAEYIKKKEEILNNGGNN